METQTPPQIQIQSQPPITPPPPREEGLGEVKHHHITPWMALVIIAAIAAGVGYWAWNTRQELYDPILLQSKESAWKTYRNEVYGFELKYPGNWFAYDVNNSPCGNQYGDTVLFRKTKLTDCNVVDIIPANLWVYVENEQRDLPKSNEFDRYEPYEIAGAYGVINYKTEKSEGPRVLDTRIYFNRNSKSYILAYENTDYKGNRDERYDQILSTFKFIKPIVEVDIDKWKVFRNDFFGYEIKTPDEYKVYGSGLHTPDQYGSGIETNPGVQIDGIVQGDSLYIEVYKNMNNYSPAQWVEGTVKYKDDNQILREGDYELQGRQGGYIVFNGTYRCEPFKDGCGVAPLRTVRLNFIKDKDRMIVISYPEYPDDCKSCPLFADIFSTFKFIK